MKWLRECQTRSRDNMDRSPQHQRYLRPLLGAVVVLLLVVGTTYAEWVNLGPRSFERLCPQHIGGDREYAGHGPEVYALAELSLVNATELWINLYMHQIETRSDWSEAELNRSFRLYSAPSGRQITAIWNATVSEVFYTDTNHSVDRFFPPDNLVREFQIKGDTGGNDIGNCTSDDAYLSVYLDSVWVWLQ
jgi:hypothetical protein